MQAQRGIIIGNEFISSGFAVWQFSVARANEPQAYYSSKATDIRHSQHVTTALYGVTTALYGVMGYQV